MLTERQLLIFQAIIDDFIESAHPVGSRTISEKDHITYSAATIRNVMADLETMGFLEKTHTSSGRVPSEKGYRYYVDHLVLPSKTREVNIIKNIIEEGIIEFEQIIQISAEVLSDLTNYTSIILGPEIYETKLKQVQIVKLSSKTAVAILITNTGHVEHRSFTVPSDMKVSDLEKLVNILNDRLIDVPIIHLPEVLSTEIASLVKRYIRNFDRTYDYLKSILFNDQSINIYIGGKSNILMQPEFKDVDKIYSFYSMMENEDEIASLLRNTKEGIKVTIGNENKIEAIKDFSLITTSYRLNHNQFGTIALLGPTRMEYRRVINLLRSLSNEMTNTFYTLYEKNE